MGPVVVLDVETTGLGDGARVCEVAGALLAHGQGSWSVSAHFTTLVDPGVPIEPEASAVHHITGEHVRGAPALDQALPSWVLEAPIAAAHNAAFDRGFLPQVAAPWLCTWRASMRRWPEFPRHNLQSLRYRLGLEPGCLAEGLQPHRALYDVACCAGLVVRLLDETQLSPADLAAQAEGPLLLRTVRFGRHRGEQWSGVPADYLGWVLRQTGERAFDADVRHTARHWLEAGAQRRTA